MTHAHVIELRRTWGYEIGDTLVGTGPLTASLTVLDRGDASFYLRPGYRVAGTIRDTPVDAWVSAKALESESRKT